MTPPNSLQFPARVQRLRPSSRLPRYACMVLTVSMAAALTPAVLAQDPNGNFADAPYYPVSTRPTILVSDDLAALQDRLTALYPTATLASPAPTGSHLATAAELAAAAAQTVADRISGSGSAITSAVTVQTLVSAIVKYRPADVATVIGPVASAIIANAAAGDLQTYLTAATAQAAAVQDGASAVPVTASVIRAIAQSPAAAGTAASAAAAAVAAQADLADSITAAAITAAKGGASSQTVNIATAAVTAAVQNGASNLIGSITGAAIRAGTVSAASAANGPIVTSPAIFTAVLQGISNGGAGDRNNILQATFAAAAAAGTNISGQSTDLNSSLTGVFGSNSNTAAASQALGAYQQIENALVLSRNAKRRTLTLAEANAVALAQLTSYLGSHSSDVDATVGAALAARPEAAVELIRKGIALNIASAGDILETSVRTLPASAASLTGAAVYQVVFAGGGMVTSGALQASLIARGVAGARPASAGAVVVAGLQQSSPAGTALNDTRLTAIIKAAIQAASAGGLQNSQAVSDIATQAAKTFHTVKTTSGTTDAALVIVAAAVKGIDPSSDLLGLTKVITGTIMGAALPGRTPASVTAAGMKADSLLMAAQAALTGGGAAAQAQLAQAETTLRDVLANKLTFYSTVTAKLGSAAGDAQVEGIVYAAGLGNPAGISAIAAAASVQSSTALSAIQSTAIAAVPGAARNVQAALDAVGHVQAHAGTDLFDYLGTQIGANNAYTSDIITGAVIAAPQYANIIAKAAAFKAPALVATKAVPAIFLFGGLNPTGAGDGAARVAAVMAGITSGLMDAKLDARTTPEFTSTGAYNTRYQTVQTTLLKENVTAVVKAALTFQSSVAYAVSATVTIGSNGHLVSSNSAPGQTTNSNLGPAGAITGLVAQTTRSGDADINLVTVGAIVRAAAAAAGEKYWITIAQAAAQAFVTVSGTNPDAFTGTATSAAVGSSHGANIVNAILASLPLSGTEKQNWLTLLTNAVSFGAQQAKNRAANPGNDAYLGIGAKGVIDYAHSSGTGPYVTNIFDL